MGPDDLRRVALFEGTGDDQLRDLLAAGTEVSFAPGDVLFQENHPADSWWVLLDGGIDLVRHVGRDETQLGSMDVPGRWAGGFRAWDEHGAYLATGRAATAGRVLCVPAAELRRIWTERFPLGLALTEGVSRSARNYETMARQREALAALGTLAAGLAHELNNPAAAATRAVDALAEACDGMLTSLRRLAAAPVTADQFTGIDALRQELGPRRPVRTRWPSPTARTPCRTGWPGTAWRRTGSWARSSPPPAPTSTGASGSRPSRGRRPWPPVWSGWPAPWRRPACSPR
ncbi:cyclic nucleotide-binding domain-containing protein [Geodermatophilus amargosae]|uniref:cyclic nucleotide-binding domain-containing protein n=1 Tax=Geodermatophilus amargosae TaxID=1296565 RepID=UPI001C3129A6|nr:cyclic nucleotide-binding domain-containing protein [Geodermatophilus amargosae]